MYIKSFPLLSSSLEAMSSLQKRFRCRISISLAEDFWFGHEIETCAPSILFLGLFFPYSLIMFFPKVISRPAISPTMCSPQEGIICGVAAHIKVVFSHPASARYSSSSTVPHHISLLDSDQIFPWPHGRHSALHLCELDSSFTCSLLIPSC